MSKKPVIQVVRWVQSANQSFKRSLSTGNSSAHGNKQWVHPPDVLQYGRVEYTVKYLGEVEVSQAKGTEVIKEAIQKIRFSLQVKRSAAGTSGSKLQKVELHINVDGLTIVDSKSKHVLYKYPLHRISFCADDKQDKRVFSFIAKQADRDQHNCFVFLSDKLAEEITLTIGEAFDLAYRKFIENNGKDLEAKKSLILLRRRISELEAENSDLKQQLVAYQRKESHLLALDPIPMHPGNKKLSLPTKWENFDPPDGSPPKLPASPIPPAPPPGIIHPPFSVPRRSNGTNSSCSPQVQDKTNEGIMVQLAQNGPDVGRRLENLHLDSMDDLFDDDFNPRAGETMKSARRTDPFGSEPFGVGGSAVPNGVVGKSSGKFGVLERKDEPEQTEEELESALSLIDSRLAEMREGFRRGISFGNEDFGGNDLLGDFDPLSSNNPA